ncbi:O-acetylserine/cysteine export protein [Citrobacter braakii]|nr:O-acetylserine/cysteine export protein [Citrobacter braakii]
MLGFMLTLAAALSWASGNIFNKKIMQHTSRPAVMSLVVWSALIPVVPFFLASILLDGPTQIIQSLVTIDMTTILSLGLSGVCGKPLWVMASGDLYSAVMKPGVSRRCRCWCRLLDWRARPCCWMKRLPDYNCSVRC